MERDTTERKIHPPVIKLLSVILFTYKYYNSVQIKPFSQKWKKSELEQLTLSCKLPQVKFPHSWKTNWFMLSIIYWFDKI